jgi:hypothetical protein
VFIILIAVVLGTIWLWATLLYGKVAFKVLRWFVRELIATPAAVSKDIRRWRERAAARRENRPGAVSVAGANPPATTVREANAEREWMAKASATVDAALAREPKAVTMMDGVPPERSEWR